MISGSFSKLRFLKIGEECALKVRECDNPYCFFFLQNYQWLNICFVGVPPNQNTINKERIYNRVAYLDKYCLRNKMSQF